MRWIFISLVVVNLLLAGWMLFQRGMDGESATGSGASTQLPRETQVRAASIGDRLVMLEELRKEELQAMVAAKERLQLQDEAEAGSDQPLCALVGPFKALLPAEYFVEHLAALEIDAQVKTVEVPGEKGFWVYLPPESSRKAALRKLHEFQAKGVDSYVIPKGDLANGISFGLFNLEAGAKERLEEIRALGYPAETRAMQRTFEEIWVVLSAQEAQKVGEELWLELLNREEGLEMRQNFCPAVASGEKFL
ncbi:SPOR domain-containing protein [Pseudomaricurvus alkylphenolicus]|jgi:hypothetical protein|uniref:SPOR domain-containing protein n=1 Tax=Pseudomaricurvus alkylphenolicus TaxID=1306991 RepID=UPI0014228E2C|nr:SPOR domain-containing protein [Pseudomaricurvus alkylphenolicus]NIB44595.1 SPOR domain-containing protein [Pseudomaricurvus alkylphenolicus]